MDEKKEEKKDNMNKKQKEAYNLVIAGHSVFLTGGGGCGKTYMLNIIKNKLRNMSKIVALTSTTGVSAILINASTIHSFLGLGIESNYDKILFKVQTNNKLLKKWQTLSTLIIDEVSMLSPELFDSIDKCFQKVRKNSKPFGGVQLVLSGDFLQLPVVKNDRFIFESDVWSKIITKENTIILDEIIRQSDIVFQTVLNEVRVGKISEKTREILLSRVKQFKKSSKKETIIEPTLLFCTNRDVDSYNKNEFKRLESKKSFEYELQIEISKGQKIHPEVIDKMKRNMGIPDKIELAIGAQIMLTYNLDVKSGLANGSRGVVTAFSIDNMPIVKLTDGTEREIGFHEFDVIENDKIVLTFIQIPLKLAYAITIHKCQGSTLDLVVMDLKNVFEYGQAYVALSRVKDISCLYLISIDFDKIVPHPKAIAFYGF